MATLDFTPLYHSTVGFDRFSEMLSHALERDESGYPPYNIEKTSSNRGTTSLPSSSSPS